MAFARCFQSYISEHFTVDHNLTLTFTYEVGPPRYMVVNGKDVSAFKHRRPEWDRQAHLRLRPNRSSPTPSTSNQVLGTFLV